MRTHWGGKKTDYFLLKYFANVAFKSFFLLPIGLFSISTPTGAHSLTQDVASVRIPEGKTGVLLSPGGFYSTWLPLGAYKVEPYLIAGYRLVDQHEACLQICFKKDFDSPFALCTLHFQCTLDLVCFCVLSFMWISWIQALMRSPLFTLLLGCYDSLQPSYLIPSAGTFASTHVSVVNKVILKNVQHQCLLQLKFNLGFCSWLYHCCMHVGTIIKYILLLGFVPSQEHKGISDSNLGHSYLFSPWKCWLSFGIQTYFCSSKQWMFS